MRRGGQTLHMTAATLTRALDPPAPLATGSVALFLDLDGTLAPIAPRPQDVESDPRLSRLILQLQTALEGRLAIVSGRGHDDIDRILAGARPVASAVHGLVERHAEGVTSTAVDSIGVDQAKQALEAFAAQASGLLVEDKGVSLALHYRLSPSYERQAIKLVEQQATELGWEVQLGRAVAELRAPGPNKGDSVRSIMTRSPFAGATPVFVGDDLTDEYGFTAAQALGGFSVVVGPRQPTAADYRLDGVPAVLDWLEASLP